MRDDRTLNAVDITLNLGTVLVGRRLHCHSTVDSTNELAKALAMKKGAPDGTVIAADWQSAGKGRLGRRWLSEPGKNLLFSVVLRPDLTPIEAGQMTMLCSLGCAEAVEAETGLPVDLKWPNDLLVASRKLGGILTELGEAPPSTQPSFKARERKVDFVVVGIGLNVNMDVAKHPEIAGDAISLASALGQSLDRIALLRAILRAIDARYLAFQEGTSPLKEWEARLVNLGKSVRVRTFEGIVEGVAEAVDATGALLVRRADGQLIRLLEGDIALGPSQRTG